MDIEKIFDENSHHIEVKDMIKFMDDSLNGELFEKGKKVDLEKLRGKRLRVYFSKSIMNVSVFGHEKVIGENLEGYNVIGGRKLMYFTIFQNGRTVISYDDKRNRSMKGNIDVIVEIREGVYLGKLFQKRGAVEKFICFFWLEEI